MRAVAKRGVLGVFAGAEEDLFVFGRLIFQRCKFRSLMRAIAKRLVRGLSAGTPEIGFTRGHIDRDRGSLSDFGGVRHFGFLMDSDGW